MRDPVCTSRTDHTPGTTPERGPSQDSALPPRSLSSDERTLLTAPIPAPLCGYGCTSNAAPLRATGDRAKPCPSPGLRRRRRFVRRYHPLDGRRDGRGYRHARCRPPFSQSPEALRSARRPQWQNSRTSTLAAYRGDVVLTTARLGCIAHSLTEQKFIGNPGVGSPAGPWRGASGPVSAGQPHHHALWWGAPATVLRLVSVRAQAVFFARERPGFRHSGVVSAGGRSRRGPARVRDPVACLDRTAIIPAEDVQNVSRETFTACLFSSATGVAALRPGVTRRRTEVKGLRRCTNVSRETIARFFACASCKCFT